MNFKAYYVYILTNQHNNVLYTGVTNDLERRIYEHKNKKYKGFTSKYNVNKLVYYEIHDMIEVAISREKEVKRYTRSRKGKIITEFNYKWEDLFKNGRILKPHKKDCKSDN